MPRNPDGLVLSNWHTLFENFSTSTQDFYTAVKAAIEARMLPEVFVSSVLFSEGGIGSPEREYLRLRRGRVAFDLCSAPYGNGHFFSWWLAKVPPRFGFLGSLAVIGFAILATAAGVEMFGAKLPPPFSVGAIVGHILLPIVLFIMVLWGLGYCVFEAHLGDEEIVMGLPVIGWLYVRTFNPITYYRLDTAMMFRDSIRSAVQEVIGELRQEKGLRALADAEFEPDVPRAQAAG